MRVGAPSITGPVEGGRHGRPFGRPLADLDHLGYVEEEWILEGEAVSYCLSGEMTIDGRWSAVAKASAPYRTRAVVYRPADPSHASGTSVLCWNNVSAGFDICSFETDEIFENGHALVALTVQRVGIVGLESMRMGLVDWDPIRYGALQHPGDDWSYDMYSQAAEAVRDDRLGGLRTTRLIAAGSSQSAARLASYYNAIQPLNGLFDGFLLHIWFGRGTRFDVGDAVLDLTKPERIAAQDFLRGQHRLRDDLSTPAFVVNSELEAIPCFHIRRPDTDSFRYWEVAATSHVSAQVQELRARKAERDFGRAHPEPSTTNRVPLTPVLDAALHHLVRWLDEGTPPPAQPTIDFVGDPAMIVRDEHGIARGGIRLPQADVPIGCNSSTPTGESTRTLLHGSWTPFPADKIRALYGDRATYLARFEEAARDAANRQVILPHAVERLVAAAHGEWDLHHRPTQEGQ